MVYEFDGDEWKQANYNAMLFNLCQRFGQATEGILRMMAGAWVGAGDRIYRMEW